MKILHTMTHMESCPHCGSMKTGIIKPVNSFTIDCVARDLRRNYKDGYYIKYVEPDKYRSYYAAYHINAFCMDCQYEFRGELEELELDSEEFDEYIQEMNLKEAIAKTERQSKFDKFFHKIEKRHQEKKEKKQKIKQIKKGELL